MKPTTPYTIRVDTQALQDVTCDKKKLRIRIAKIVNNYLKKQK